MFGYIMDTRLRLQMKNLQTHARFPLVICQLCAQFENSNIKMNWFGSELHCLNQYLNCIKYRVMNRGHESCVEISSLIAQLQLRTS
ncbi:hypothetical protein FKM82_008615 [Ascaphus truei]